MATATVERGTGTMTSGYQQGYAKVFRKIHPETLKATIELKKAGVWKRDVSLTDKTIAMGIWITKVSAIYGIEPPKFYFVQDQTEYARTGGGCYFPTLHEAYLFEKPSIMTLLHEFRHAVQTKKPDMPMHRNEAEEDARAWSHSVFRRALPVSYRNAMEKGLFHHS